MHEISADHTKDQCNMRQNIHEIRRIFGVGVHWEFKIRAAKNSGSQIRLRLPRSSLESRTEANRVERFDHIIMNGDSTMLECPLLQLDGSRGRLEGNSEADNAGFG